VWVLNLVSHAKEGAQIEGVRTGCWAEYLDL